MSEETQPTELEGHGQDAWGGHGDGEPEDEIWGKKHKKRKKYKLAGENISHLNLTPMMDIMTILLVFLIQSFATEPANININIDLQPPQSTAEKLMEGATKVTITAKEILVDNEVVAKIDELKLNGQKDIPAVRDALIERADHLKQLEGLGGEPFDGRLDIVAHQTTPYSIVTAVLYSAGQAKFGQFKLVVMKKGAKE